MSKKVILAWALSLLMLLTSCSSADSHNNKAMNFWKKANMKRQ